MINEAIQQQINKGKMLPLMEEFYTIQGEGFHTGKAAYFIRIGGCDVGCHWCDVKESWNANLHPPTSADTIVKNAKKYANTVVVTGGEPLMWSLDYITKKLQSLNLKTHIETSGSSPLSGQWDWICLSPKKTMPPREEFYAVADELKASKEELIQAYFAAGLVGVYFANGPGFSAEEHGCQVECGASAGMAAAGIVQLFGGTAIQAIDAASMAIQNMIGLVCDPIADRVEAPCLGKNVSAAVNALSSATMVASGFNALIPLDEVISTVSSVSSQMPTCVKCTGKGGLAITKTACAIKAKLSSQMV